MALSSFAWLALLVAALCAAAGIHLLLKLGRIAPEPAPTALAMPAADATAPRTEE